MSCLWATCGLELRYLWAVHRLLFDCGRAASGLEVGSGGLGLYYKWAGDEMFVGCLWVVCGLPGLPVG